MSAPTCEYCESPLPQRDGNYIVFYTTPELCEEARRDSGPFKIYRLDVLADLLDDPVTEKQMLLEEIRSSPVRLWRYVCVGCVEHIDDGYWIPLSECSDVAGLSHWNRHMKSKRWYREPQERALRTAAEWMMPKPLPAPVQPEVPARIISTAPNPRSISTRTRSLVFERDGFRCRRCGAEPTHSRLVVDHVVPVAKGGTADLANLQTLCWPCNAGKADREPTSHDLVQR